MSVVVLCLFLISVAAASTAEQHADLSSRSEVTSLPGFDGELLSKHHSGYLTVDRELGSYLFYYFVESEGNPAQDPVVLWLNGGPGCSSFDGFVYEHGPFKYDFNHGDVKLTTNPFAWSKVANMIYLDSPAGVGLSYGEGREFYETDDVKTTTDLHAAVLKFFEIFPEFKSNRFFVSGESYAGIYVPLLVHNIVRGNLAGTLPNVNLIGYLIGNGCTDIVVDNDAFPPFAFGKSLISKKLFNSITDACDGKYWNTTYGSDCYNLQVQAYEDLLAHLNIYDVARECEMPPEEIQNGASVSPTTNARSFLDENGIVWPMGPLPNSGRVHNWRTATNNEAPCSDYWTAEAWFNREDVREAIHAAPLNVAGKFVICSDRVAYNKTIPSVFGVHWRLINYFGMHALIFSGDHDMAVPHTGTEEWTMMLGQPVISEWKEWLDNQNQVGGYHVEYEHLTYCTVRNAGHMVPQTHPAQALEMFHRYITHLSMEVSYKTT